MPSTLDEEGVLAEAEALERRHHWMKAAELYGQALHSAEEQDFLKTGEFGERIGYCLYRAAMQAESRQEFMERMRRAVEVLEKACGSYEKLESKRKAARMFRCRAVASYVGHFLTPDPSAEAECIRGSLELEEKALTGFLESGEMLEYGRTYAQLFYFPFFLIYLLSFADTQFLKYIFERGIEWGNRAVAALSELGSLNDLASTHFTLAVCLRFLGGPRGYVADAQERDRLILDATKHLRTAVDISEKTGDAFLLGWAHIFLFLYNVDVGEQAARDIEESVEYAKRSGHKGLLAASLGTLAYYTHWKATTVEDPLRRRELAEKAMEYHDEAQHYYSITSFIIPVLGLMAHFTLTGYADHYLAMAMWETDNTRRMQFLEKAEKAGMKSLKSCRDSGIQANVATCLHTVSRILEARANSELDSAERRSWLTRALNYREEAIRMAQQHYPFSYWQLGVMRNHLAEIKAGLSDLEPDPDNRLEHLEEAVSNKEECLYLCNLAVPTGIGDVRYLASIQRYQDNFATLLMRLCELTNEQEHLKKAIEISENAIESATKLDLVTRKAESYWKKAEAENFLGGYLKAAESFEHASESYELAANRIPQLRNFYSDYASYMKAWAELERSRHEHENENYAQSQEHYRMCSRILETTGKWSYLSSYYYAWSLLERGEELSKLDKPQEAMNAFDEANRTFSDSANTLRVKHRELESSEEGDEASKLATVAGLRSQYSMGRALMEEARLSNRKGDRVSSAARYSSAAEIFENVGPKLESEEGRLELQFTSTLCRAWENMVLAEERDDTSLYRNAAELFANAGKISRRKTGKMIALGNSCFCEALELGMQFMLTSNTDSYSGAKSRMQHAARYYRRAGSENNALWVDATKRLLDAHVYADRAETEADPDNRARFYLMAEECLGLSAELFEKGGYQEKRKEALRSLKVLRQERELALSLKKVLTPPTILSRTDGVSMPDSTERAAGLNSFESVNIRIHLSVPKEFVPGKEFQVKLDLINVGKESGLLIRVEGIVPRKSEVLRIPSYCSLIDDSLDMKGKMLRPLSVDSVIISVKVNEMVNVNISPKVIYSDELGNFRTISVEGESILPIVRFDSKAAKAAFTYLVKAFEEDSTKRRLDLEKSGWRSLPQIISGARVSKGNMYGANRSPGPVLSELLGKGLVDLRVFRGRGRGGHVSKVRIHHEKELIKRFL